MTEKSYPVLTYGSDDPMRDLDAFLQKLLPEMGKAKSNEVLLKSYMVYQVGKRFADAIEERAQHAAMCNVPKREEWVAAAFCRCMEEAVTEFADLLTQALIARRRAITRRRSQIIIEEALQFASYYTEWRYAGGWLAVALGLNRAEVDKVEGFSGMVFMQPIREAISLWAERARARIMFRSLLSAKPAQPLPQHDVVKLVIARMKRDKRGISQKDLCGRLDAMNDRNDGESVPVLSSWQRVGERTWSGALRNPKLRNPVKRYLSGVKPAPRRTLSPAG